MKNWKTTLFGALAAIGIALAPQFPQYTEVIAAFAAVFTALAAFFAKDNNVTGGTVKQNETDPPIPPKG